jgi:thiol-disulfide isomerase/thioredoxin
MEPLRAGQSVPVVPGIVPADGPRALVFFKVTCPVCQMAAPRLAALHEAYPGRVRGLGQDPQERLEEFDREYGLRIPVASDLPPYEGSEAFGIRVVPTTFLLDDDRIADVVESWDRDGLNRLSHELARLLGAPYRPISDPSDGLPPFRPG